MDSVADGALFAVGLFIAAGTVSSAVRTFVVPRAEPVLISRTVFRWSRHAFAVVAGRRATGRRERVLGFYAPFTLLLLEVTWLSLVLAGYTLQFAALGDRGFRQAFELSGSSMFTLGFDRPGDLPSLVLAFTEAGLGIGLLALLITYLPSIYGAFSRREAVVGLLEVRAGSPPSGEEMLVRLHLIGLSDDVADLWARWEEWFVELDESHTSLGPLTFFRSPQPDRSWITAAGAVLDAASLDLAVLARHPVPQASLLIRSGYVALRHIADFFDIPYDPDPEPTAHISVTRAEFDGVYDRLAAEGLPVHDDRDRCWRDFAGWRVNYDGVLVALARLVDAPPAPWSSDRPRPATNRPSLHRRWSR